jgi:hypothetical protein
LRAVSRIGPTLSVNAAMSRCNHNEEFEPMPRKPNYEFERRERDRLKAIKNAEKAAAKKEARERARAEAGDKAAPAESDDKS